MRKRVFLHLVNTEYPGETDISTIKAGTQAASRLSGPQSNRGRSQSSGHAPRTRTQAAVRLRSGFRPLDQLKQRKDFLRVAKGRRWATPGLVLQAAKRPDSDVSSRIGYTASKKVGNAVKRNRAKRRLRALVKDVLLNTAQEGFDYVLVARYTTPDRPYQALIEDLKLAVQKVHNTRKQRDT